jgi:AcrR family transcriptional regulator
MSAKPLNHSEEDAGRRQQILDAAFTVFAREGYHKATIKAIASEAALKSPALIYWYFKDKGELFESVVLECSPLLSAVPDLMGRVEEPPEVVLPLLAKAYLGTIEMPQGKDMFRIFLSEVAQRPELGEQLARNGFLPFKTFLVSYLERQVTLGRLRPHNTTLAAGQLVGMLFMYLFSNSVMPSMTEGLEDSTGYAEQVVDVFLHGLEKTPGATGKTTQKKKGGKNK